MAFESSEATCISNNTVPITLDNPFYFLLFFFLAQKACDAGVSDTARYIIDGSRLCCDTRLPQEDEMPSDHNLNPKTPERTGPPLSDTVGFSKSSGCDQEKEEEEEVEVDVLLYSPDKVLRTKECENGLDSMHIISPEEEEEEDVHEIDVTGDEAE